MEKVERYHTVEEERESKNPTGATSTILQPRSYRAEERDGSERNRIPKGRVRGRGRASTLLLLLLATVRLQMQVLLPLTGSLEVDRCECAQPLSITALYHQDSLRSRRCASTSFSSLSRVEEWKRIDLEACVIAKARASASLF